MSAILPDFDGGFELGPDGVRRYHTTCKVIVHSHDSDAPIDISQDVMSIATSKSTKGTGSSTVILTPTKNYLNLINANDYINIYFNVGDGTGLTRTFFGFVDRIEETYAVDRQGRPNTTYHVVCSDFQKVFEMTHIYYNPHLAGRDDLIGETFGTDRIGGVALASKGVSTHGSPADILQNLIILMLGFGTQFSLPDSYNPTITFESRTALLDYVESSLNSESRKVIADAGGFEKFLAQERASANLLVKSQDADAQAEGRGQTPEELIASRRDTFTAGLQDKLQGDPANAANFGPGIVNAIPGVGDRVPSLLDILNIFDFVELASIDGYTSGTAIWQHTGPISSLMRTYSNEIVNELIFDLRPLTITEDQEDYAFREDEISGNVDSKGRTGITHSPAVVMREYPWATINAFDGTDVETNIRDENDNIVKIGKIPFGAVFSNRKNIPGRHNIEFPAISHSQRVRGKAISVNNRKLDVAVVREQEIKKSTFGKTDHEHVNLIETTAEGILGKSFKFLMKDLQPITTPIHIMRNGLRVRSNPTRFVLFDTTVSGSLEVGTKKPLGQEEAEIDAAAEKEVVKSDIDGLQAPIQGGGTEHGLSKYGYRKPGGIFKFHNGVDIYAPIGTNVFAIADGVLVASAPKGGFAYYSQTVIIKHPNMGPGGVDLFSQYSHLSESFVDQQFDVGTKRRVWVSKSMQANGQLAETEIKAGDRIGLVGNESGTLANPEGKFKFAQPHLHFELLVKAAGLVYPAKRGAVSQARIADIELRTGGATVFKPKGVLRKEHGVNGATPHIDPKGVNLDAAFRNKTFPLEGDNERTLDPVAFFKENANISLFEAATASSGKPTLDPDESEAEEPEEEEEDSNVPAAEDPKPTVEALKTLVAKGESRLDSSLSSPVLFKQLARWSLLQDHWYQHNSEYLSGSIEMRGAPEIRVGYRLDLPDRGLSFYVEAVNHSWQFPNDMVTVLQVTRGQPNEPFPLYVPPVPHNRQAKNADSRMAKFFIIPDPIAVRRGIALRSSDYDFTPTTKPTAGQDLEDPAKYLPEDTLPADEDSNDVVSGRNDSRNISDFISDDFLPDLEEGLEFQGQPSTGVEGTETNPSSPKKPG